MALDRSYSVLVLVFFLHFILASPLPVFFVPSTCFRWCVFKFFIQLLSFFASSACSARFFSCFFRTFIMGISTQNTSVWQSIHHRAYATLQHTLIGLYLYRFDGCQFYSSGRPESAMVLVVIKRNVIPFAITHFAFWILYSTDATLY